MNKEQDFFVNYEDIHGENKTVIIGATSHHEAGELLESEDPDSGQIFAIRNAKEQSAYERLKSKHSPSYSNLENLSI